MGRIFRWAMELSLIPDEERSNPVRRVKPPKFRKQEQISLQPQDAWKLVSSLPPLEKTLVLLASITGMRQGELLGLKWMDIDVSKKADTIPPHLGSRKGRFAQD